MYNTILGATNKFVEFLTSNLGSSPIKMWMLLTAIIVVIIAAGIIIGVVMDRREKRRKANNAESKPNSEPAVTAPPSMQSISEGAIEKPSKDVDSGEPCAAKTEPRQEATGAAKEELPVVSAKPPVKEADDKSALYAHNSAAKTESAPARPVNAEQTAADNVKTADKAEAVRAKQIVKPVNKTAEIKSVPASNADSALTAAKPAEQAKTESVKTDTSAQAKPAIKESVKAEAAADKAGANSKIIARKMTNPPQKDAEPKKAKIVGIEALPKKIKNNIKLEEAKAKLETPEPGETFGKYVILKDDANPLKPFKFALRANNGQLLFESEPYKVKPREASIQAFKKHVQVGDFIVDEDKFGFFRFKLYTDAGKLLGVGESYKSKSQCESSIESVKRFSVSATLIEDTTVEEDAQ